MTRVKLTSVRTFPNVQPDKAQALKVLEAAAEVVEAFKFLEEVNGGMMMSVKRSAFADLMDEIADTIQACCNLAASLGVTDLAPYLARCEERNRERGRYE